MILRHAASFCLHHLCLKHTHIHLYFLAFTIQCAVRWSNRTNAPFEISSGISLSQLHLAVSEKLSCFPDHLILQYRLDSDKAKTGATSIQADSELEIFIAKMWNILVPPCLTNGKPSTHAPKNVLVYFEDAANANTLNETHGNKKAMASHYYIFMLHLRTDDNFHPVLDYITSGLIKVKPFVRTEWWVRDNRLTQGDGQNAAWTVEVS